MSREAEGFEPPFTGRGVQPQELLPQPPRFFLERSARKAKMPAVMTTTARAVQVCQSVFMKRVTVIGAPYWKPMSLPP